MVGGWLWAGFRAVTPLAGSWWGMVWHVRFVDDRVVMVRSRKDLRVSLRAPGAVGAVLVGEGGCVLLEVDADERVVWAEGDTVPWCDVRAVVGVTVDAPRLEMQFDPPVEGNAVLPVPATSPAPVPVLPAAPAPFMPGSGAASSVRPVHAVEVACRLAWREVVTHLERQRGAAVNAGRTPYRRTG